jgi:hypothetical protein
MSDNGRRSAATSDEPDSLKRLADCLHASFTADNHDSLSDEITHSLLHLSCEEKTDSMRTKLSLARSP